MGTCQVTLSERNILPCDAPLLHVPPHWLLLVGGQRHAGCDDIHIIIITMEIIKVGFSSAAARSPPFKKELNTLLFFFLYCFGSAGADYEGFKQCS